MDEDTKRDMREEIEQQTRERIFNRELVAHYDRLAGYDE